MQCRAMGTVTKAGHCPVRHREAVFSGLSHSRGSFESPVEVSDAQRS